MIIIIMLDHTSYLLLGENHDSLELLLKMEKFNLQLKKHLGRLLPYLLQMKSEKPHKELRS